MKYFINDKLRMLFICKDVQTVREMAMQCVIDIDEFDSNLFISHHTCKQLMTLSGRRTKDIKNDNHGMTTIKSPLGIYQFYNAKIGYTPLLGKRVDVVVIDDNLEIEKNHFRDMVEPIASEHGGMILMSLFESNGNKTKYTRKIHRHVVELHSKMVYDKIIKEDNTHE